MLSVYLSGMLMWLAMALQAAQPLPDTAAFELSKIDKPRETPKLSVIARCADTPSSDEIVVCGARQDRYRLPLLVERLSAERGRGETQTGLAALTPAAPCGIFAGQRRCSKKEAAEYGYGQGRDPISVAVKVASKLLDPDGN
jgi:hypothetical protein